jgi:DNA-binding FadR family transcriptional regulator
VLLDSTRLQIGRVRRLSAPIPGRIALLVQQHKKIADCVIAGDSPGSAQAMQAHMQDVYPFIERIYAEHPDAFGPSPRGTTTTS